MMLDNIGKYLKSEKKPLERFRIFTLIFEKPLPSLVMNGLLTEKRFISKYSRISKLRMDEEIQALIIYDYADINYVLNIEKIEAKSAIVDKPEAIIKSLKSMADLIIELYGLEFKYKIEGGADFRYIENYDLQKVISGAEITKRLKKEFKNNIFAVQCKYVYKSKDQDEVINIVYATPDDFKNKRLLIEADEKYIDRIHGALKND